MPTSRAAPWPKRCLRSDLAESRLTEEAQPGRDAAPVGR